MPNAPKTPVRSIRLSDERWEALDKAAGDAGTDRVKLIAALVAWYLREKGARLPQRPDAAAPPASE